MHPALVTDLGGYLREQRLAARMSLRQLSDLAGISNPYLSQIERGLKKPSAEILQQIAHGLQLSAESLFVRAGILEEGQERAQVPGVVEAVAADPHLTPKQRGVLLEVYRAFVSQTATHEQSEQLGEPAEAAQPADVTGTASAGEPAPSSAPAAHPRPASAEPTPQPN